MDIPDPISFLNRFGTNQRSVVQVMSRQSMPKNHVFIQNHKAPFSKQATFNSFQNQSKHANFIPFLWNQSKYIKFNITPLQLTHWHFTTIHQNHYPIILTHFTQVAQTQTHWHILYSSSCQFSTTPIPINHYCTQLTSYSPSTWFNPQFNHNQSSSIYHNMHISHTSYHQGIINHHHIYDHIIYINNSTTSTIQCLS